MHPDLSQPRLPWDYFALVFGLSLPLWILSSALGNRLPIPLNLPISAFQFLIPVVAASILLHKRRGPKGVRRLLARALEFPTAKVWYLPALLLVPAIYIASYVVMRAKGLPLPDPITIPLGMAPVFFALYLIAATGEELGWSGYAIDPMQDRWSALTGALFLGVMWQIWHIVADIQANNNALWIVWHSLYSIALRVLMVWIYNCNQRHVFPAILMHATDNVSWSMFPNYGSHFDPFIAFLMTAPVAVVVTILWGPKTLARSPHLAADSP